MCGRLILSTTFVLFFAAGFVSSASAEWVAGYEGDDVRGYGFITRLQHKPLSRNTEIIFFATGSYRFYRIVEETGTTRVASPGIAGGAVYRWNLERLTAGAGGGYEVRWMRRSSPDLVDERLEQGPLALADLGYDITSLTTFNAAAAYSGADEWVSSRANVTQELAPALRIGPEIGLHGNEDVRVRDLGGVAQLGGDRRGGGVYIRAGRSQIRYRGGAEEERPYFSVGYYRAFF